MLNPLSKIVSSYTEEESILLKESDQKLRTIQLAISTSGGTVHSTSTISGQSNLFSQQPPCLASSTLGHA